MADDELGVGLPDEPPLQKPFEFIHTPPVGPEGPVIPAPPVTPKPAPAPPIEPEPTPGAPEALPDIFTLSGLILLLGLIALAAALVTLLNNMWNRAVKPFVPRAKSDPLTTIGLLQPLSNTLGNWELKLDTYIGLSFVQLAQLVGRVGGAILAGEEALYQVVQWVTGLDGRTRAQEAAQARNRAAIQTAQHTAAQGLQQAQATQAQLQHAEQTERHRADGLQHHIAHLLEPELDALRKRIPHLEQGIADLGKVVETHAEHLSLEGVVAGTALGLSRLGGEWIRCDSNRALGEAVCANGGNGLKNLLKGLLDIAAILDLCQLVGLLLAVAESGPVQDVFAALQDGIETLIVCRGIELAKPLPTTHYAATAATLTAYASPAYV